MKITFDHNNTNQNVDRVTTSYQDIRTTRSGKTDVYALDISGTVMDNNAYKGQGKTAEEVMQEAGQTDIAVQRDFMTVMSNIMSTGDFNRMMEEGYQPGDMDVEEIVTIVDKIKAELLKGGTRITGYTDQMDAETLKAITGSEAFAQELCKQFAVHDVPVTEENVQDAKKAYEEATAVTEITEGAAKYMVENCLEPTIASIYKADYSSIADGSRQGKGYYAAGVSGYYAKKADDFNWEQLQPQIEKVIEQAGLEVNEETLSDAKWLIEKGIPLTKEAVLTYHQINTLSFPQKMEDILSAIAAAISDGKKAEEANLADGRSLLEKAADYLEEFAQISKEAVYKTVEQGKTLNLMNLKAAQEQIDKETAKQGTSQMDMVYQEAELIPENITARRQLEEVRLMMTIETNYKLLSSGYYIDTTELEQLVEALKQEEDARKQLLFGETDVNKASEKASLYTETRSKIEEIPHLPLAVVGKFKAASEDFTLNQVHISGSALKDTYEQAQERYEELMTAPRADMGDSIRKAFRNVDDILQDMDMELTEENRRAVRILGYNSMELTEENIQAVKESDLQLRRVIAKMTPAATLQTIRDGKNPLEMSLAQLNDYLDSADYSKEQEDEKYSRFLYKLEKNKEISEDEREAYIGIYRMLRQIEKTDDAAVGTLLHNGAELSFKNLLSALRSSKKQGMDYTVDDNFGGMESVLKNVSITEQITNGFHAYAQNVAGETADAMAALEEPEIAAQYQEEQLEEYRQAGREEDSIVWELLSNKQSVTPNNLLAAGMLIYERGSLYRKLNELTKSADKESKVKDAVSHLQENMVDKESAQEAYEKLQQVYEEVLEEAQADSKTDYLDLKTIQNCRKQLTLTGNLAKEENYHVPVEINGETTEIHLKVLHDGQESGTVKAVMETESYGKVAAQFSVRNGKVTGYIACSTMEGTKDLQDKDDKLHAELEKQVEALVQDKLELGSIGIIQNRDLDLNRFVAAEKSETEEDSENTTVQTVDLYQIAKAFIAVMKA